MPAYARLSPASALVAEVRSAAASTWDLNTDRRRVDPAAALGITHFARLFAQDRASIDVQLQAR
jgi:hypothetical protein